MSHDIRNFFFPKGAATISDKKRKADELTFSNMNLTKLIFKIIG